MLGGSRGGGGGGKTGVTLNFSSSVGWDTASTVYPTKILSIPKIFFCKLATPTPPPPQKKKSNSVP